MSEIFLGLGGTDYSIQALIIPYDATPSALALVERLTAPGWRGDEVLSAAWGRVVFCAPVFSAVWRSRTSERPPCIRLYVSPTGIMPS